MLVQGHDLHQTCVLCAKLNWFLLIELLWSMLYIIIVDDQI